MARRILILSLFLAGAPCAEEADLPAGWDGAARMAAKQAPAPDGWNTPRHQQLVLVRDMAGLRGTYQDAPFACHQSLCAYRLDHPGAAQVLVQPCDMNMGSDGECRYDVDFPLDDVAAGAMVELFRRDGRTAGADEPAPALVDRERAP